MIAFATGSKSLVPTGTLAKALATACSLAVAPGASVATPWVTTARSSWPSDLRSDLHAVARRRRGDVAGDRRRVQDVEGRALPVDAGFVGRQLERARERRRPVHLQLRVLAGRDLDRQHAARALGVVAVDGQHADRAARRDDPPLLVTFAHDRPVAGERGAGVDGDRAGQLGARVGLVADLERPAVHRLATSVDPMLEVPSSVQVPVAWTARVWKLTKVLSASPLPCSTSALVAPAAVLPTA